MMLVFAAGSAFLLIAATFPFVLIHFRRWFDWSKRNSYELLLTSVMALFLACLILVPLGRIVDRVLLFPWSTFHAEDLLGRAYWPLWLGVGAAVATFLLAGAASSMASQLARAAIVYAVGFVGPASIFAVYLFVCASWVRIPYLSLDVVDDLFLASAESETRTAALDSRGPGPLWGELERRGILTNAHFAPLSHRVKRYDEAKRWDIFRAKVSEAGQLALCPSPSQQLSTGEVSHEDDGATTSEAPDCVLIARIHEYGDRLWIEVPTHLGVSWHLLLLFALILLAVNQLFLDVNITSPHGFYRDRLSKAFLMRLARKDDREVVESNDGVKLSELNSAGSKAPYHLINVALNLEGSGEPDVRGRNAEFFIFSKLFSGSSRTGYCDTRLLEGADGHLNLGTAMAISAGAAAPNMGATTIRPLVFIMTLLNIRLGYWLPNPARVARQASTLRNRYMAHAGARYLFREALGLVDERRGHVNLSDGGHLENTGIYELLRRRCRLVIAVDGECDPTLEFGSLVTLIRFAVIDMGVGIEIDLANIRDKKVHFATGTIHYSPSELGYLLYIKASLTTDENLYVLDYAARNPLFPHESTADQFFSETQFEAYRALGEHIAGEAQSEALRLMGLLAVA